MDGEREREEEEEEEEEEGRKDMKSEREWRGRREMNRERCPKLHLYLSCFPTTSLPHQHNRSMFLHCLHEFGVVLPHWQVLSLFQDLPEPCGKGPTCVFVDLDLGNRRGLVGKL